MNIWVFRVLAAIASVVVTAIAGIKADTGHFGMWALIVAAAQVVILKVLGDLVRKWSA